MKYYINYVSDCVELAALPSTMFVVSQAITLW